MHKIFMIIKGSKQCRWLSTCIFPSLLGLLRGVWAVVLSRVTP